MNLHTLGARQASAAFPIPGFYLTAINMPDGTSYQYGPFPGEPTFTYETLNCYYDGTDAPSCDIEIHPPHTIFAIYDGFWHRAWQQPVHDTEPSLSHQITSDVRWTDLNIEPGWFPAITDWAHLTRRDESLP